MKLENLETKYKDEIKALKHEIERFNEVKTQFESVKHENGLLKNEIEENKQLK